MNQKGVVHLYLLVAAIGVIAFLGITSFAPFRDKLLGSLFLKSKSEAASGDWATVAYNAQRTSWSTEQVTGNNVLWYRPIEAYIPPNSQIIAANGMIYIATARGVYALDASNGSEKWRFDTELPIGNSPTVFNGVLYVGGFDRKVYALDAITGNKKWEFAQATAGYRTNPLVLQRGTQTIIYIGSRDGNFYAIEDKGSSASLLWSFKTGGPINISAAANKAENTVYFASNDNFAYALNADTGAKVWQSQKLPGNGFHSYWPTVYTDPATQNEYVILMGATSYRTNASPGTQSVNNQSLFDTIQRDDLFFDNNVDGTKIGPIANPANATWAHGQPIINYSRVSEYLENNPANNPNLHKPYRRTWLVLNASDGAEYTQDVDNDGFKEYAPIAFFGTRGGAHQSTPAIGPDGVIYLKNVYERRYIPQAETAGWKFGTPYFSIWNKWNANDEPVALSGGGNVLYRVLCCDRMADWFDITTGVSGLVFEYNQTLIGKAPGYNQMWWGVQYQPNGFEKALGWYGGDGKSGTPHNGRNGVYESHGDQNPLVPYQGKLFIHRSNAIIAFGSNSAPVSGKLPLLTVNPVSENITPPTPADLKLRLEDEVTKIISAGNLRPGYYETGFSNIDQLKDYFRNPGETLLTLSTAYPYLSPGLQNQVKTYLQSLFATYFDPGMYSRIGWSEGAGREAYSIPPDIQQSLSSSVKDTNPGGWSWSYPQYNFYAMWKYSQIFKGDSNYKQQVQRIYDLAKSKIQVPASASDTYLQEYPFEHNGYIAGYLGFIKLSDDVASSGGVVDSVKRTQVQNELDRLLALRASTFTKDNPWTDCSTLPECTSPSDFLLTGKRIYNVSRNFIYLVPELGDYLNQNALAKVQAAVSDYNYVAPYWMASKFEATASEGVFQPLWDQTMFLAKAYVLKEPYSELTKWLDVPGFEKGDLIYIQNLTAALSASGASSPSSSPSSNPSSTKVGDLDSDNDVDIFDYNLLLTSFGQTGSNLPTDLDSSGKVDIFDYNILLTNFGK